MSEMLQTGELAADNRLLLAYMQHMAQTAQPAAAKRLFTLFAEQEKQRVEENGGFQLPASGHGIGGAQMPLASVSEAGAPRG